MNVCAKPLFKADLERLVSSDKRGDLLIALEEFLAENPYSGAQRDGLYIKQIPDPSNNRSLFAYYSIKDENVLLESLLGVTTYISDELANMR